MTKVLGFSIFLLAVVGSFGPSSLFASGQPVANGCSELISCTSSSDYACCDHPEYGWCTHQYQSAIRLCPTKLTVCKGTLVASSQYSEIYDETQYILEDWLQLTFGDELAEAEIVAAQSRIIYVSPLQLNQVGNNKEITVRIKTLCCNCSLCDLGPPLANEEIWRTYEFKVRVNVVDFVRAGTVQKESDHPTIEATNHRNPTHNILDCDPIPCGDTVSPSGAAEYVGGKYVASISDLCCARVQAQMEVKSTDFLAAAQVWQSTAGASASATTVNKISFDSTDFINVNVTATLSSSPIGSVKLGFVTFSVPSFSNSSGFQVNQVISGTKTGSWDTTSPGSDYSYRFIVSRNVQAVTSVTPGALSQADAFAWSKNNLKTSQLEFDWMACP